MQDVPIPLFKQLEILSSYCNDLIDNNQTKETLILKLKTINELNMSILLRMENKNIKLKEKNVNSYDLLRNKKYDISNEVQLEFSRKDKYLKNDYKEANEYCNYENRSEGNINNSVKLNKIKQVDTLNENNKFYQKINHLDILDKKLNSVFSYNTSNSRSKFKESLTNKISSFDKDIEKRKIKTSSSFRSDLMFKSTFINSKINDKKIFVDSLSKTNLFINKRLTNNFNNQRTYSKEYKHFKQFSVTSILDNYLNELC